MLMDMRPLRIQVPRRARLGEPLRVVLNVSGFQGVATGAEVRLRCELLTSLRGRPARETLWSERATVAWTGRKAPLSEELVFQLPRDLPPSHRGRIAEIRYLVEVGGGLVSKEGRVLRIDEVAGVEVRSAAPNDPYFGSTRTTVTLGAAFRFFEVELDNSRLARGQVLSGRFALRGIPASRIRQVQVRLVAKERVQDAFGDEVDHADLFELHAATMEVDESDRWQDFRMTIPDRFPYSFRGRRIRVDAAVLFVVELAWAAGGTIDLPIIVDADAAVAATPAKRIAPAGWTSFAEGTGFLVQGDQLERDIGAVRIRVALAERLLRDPILAAQLRYRSLRLGLSLKKDNLGRGELQVLTCRDPEQAAAFVAAIAEPVRRLETATIEDGRTYAAIRAPRSLQSASQREDRQVVRNFLASISRLAKQIEGARRIVPPPAPLRDCVGRWQSLARSLDGRLDLGCMAISGQWEGMGVQIDTGWSPSGQPVSTSLRLRTPWWLGDHRRLSTTADIDALPMHCREEARRVLSNGHHLEIADSEMVLVTSPVTEQLSLIEDQLGRLTSLAHRLRTSAVYR